MAEKKTRRQSILGRDRGNRWANAPALAAFRDAYPGSLTTSELTKKVKQTHRGFTRSDGHNAVRRLERQKRILRDKDRICSVLSKTNAQTRNRKVKSWLPNLNQPPIEEAESREEQEERAVHSRRREYGKAPARRVGKRTITGPIKNESSNSHFIKISRLSVRGKQTKTHIVQFKTPNRTAAFVACQFFIRAYMVAQDVSRISEGKNRKSSSRDDGWINAQLLEMTMHHVEGLIREAREILSGATVPVGDLIDRLPRYEALARKELRPSTAELYVPVAKKYAYWCADQGLSPYSESACEEFLELRRRSDVQVMPLGDGTWKVDETRGGCRSPDNLAKHVIAPLNRLFEWLRSVEGKKISNPIDTSDKIRKLRDEFEARRVETVEKRRILEKESIEVSYDPETTDFRVGSKITVRLAKRVPKGTKTPSPTIIGILMDFLWSHPGQWYDAADIIVYIERVTGKPVLDRVLTPRYHTLRTTLISGLPLDHQKLIDAMLPRDREYGRFLLNAKSLPAGYVVKR